MNAVQNLKVFKTRLDRALSNLRLLLRSISLPTHFHPFPFVISTFSNPHAGCFWSWLYSGALQRSPWTEVQGNALGARLENCGSCSVSPWEWCPVSFQSHRWSRLCHLLPDAVTTLGSPGAGAAGGSQCLGVRGQARGWSP